jgi:hypothetical protein
MSGKTFVEKYQDPGNPIVSVRINNILVPNTLIDLWDTINIMTLQTMEKLKLINFRPTPTIIELAERSKIKQEGMLDDAIVSLDSWEYPFDLMVLQPKIYSGGHPLILARPWLATADMFIGCRSRNTLIYHGDSVKNVTLYPLAKSSYESQNTPWIDATNSDEKIIQSIYAIDQIIQFKEHNEENQLQSFLVNLDPLQDPDLPFDHIFIPNFQEYYDTSTSSSLQISALATNMTESSTIPIDISPGKVLHINSQLDNSQQEQLIQMMKKNTDALAWSYPYMKGIHLDTCTHHIYIRENARPIIQLQRLMNHALKEIVKEELQKLLDAQFIYPISDSQWVSPLVIVPKKNGSGIFALIIVNLKNPLQKNTSPLCSSTRC